MSKDTSAEAALVALIPQLTRRARHLTRSRSDAEDLVQEALLQVWARQRTGPEIDTLPAYAMTTLRHATHRRARQDARVEALEHEPESPGDDGPRRVLFADVLRAIAGLPEPQRRLVLALLTRDVSYAELARSESLPLGTVMSRLARARARLRRDCGLEDGAPVASLFEGRRGP